MQIKILFLLSAFALSASAQIEKVWELKIENVNADSTNMSGMISGLLIGNTGSILLNLPSAGLINVEQTEGKPVLAWISKEGKLIHIWKSTDESIPAKHAIIQFNDDYILTYGQALSRGQVWVWEAENGGLKLTERRDVWAGVWFLPNSDMNMAGNPFGYPEDSVFYGAQASPRQQDAYIVFAKYRIQTKSPTFWIQQSEDLETWKDLIEVPQGESPKEFFRISPE